LKLGQKAGSKARRIQAGRIFMPHATPRKLGPETGRNQARRLAEGFIERYLSGDAVLDIGYRGGTPDAEPVTEKAIGVELDYPGYDGVRLPFPDDSQDAVFASHTLEHVEDYATVLADWYRVLRIGGYLIIAVPHQQLYERKAALPSRFNGDHKRFYTPASLLSELETSLPVGGFRIRSLRDIDSGFSYDVPPEEIPLGCYEIELVVEKIAIPAYAARLVASPAAEQMIRCYAGLVAEVARARSLGEQDWTAQTLRVLLSLPLPPFQRVLPFFPGDVDMADIKAVLRQLVENAPFDEAFYLARYPDIRDAVAAGRTPSGKAQFVANGYFKNRISQPVFPLFD
jgi:SAM-dependent methyltransferase